MVLLNKMKEVLVFQRFMQVISILKSNAQKKHIVEIRKYFHNNQVMHN